MPAVVIGFHDPSSLIGTIPDATNYATSYFVFSKKLMFDFGLLDFTFGYSKDFFDLRYKDFEGFFGGFEFKPTFSKNISLNIENNSKGYNIGVKLNIFTRFNLMFGLWRLEKPTFSFNYML